MPLFSSDCNEYFVYPEDTQYCERETGLPSKLDTMDGLRSLEFESSTVSTILWSSDDCGVYLEDTDNAPYIDGLLIHPLRTSNATQHRCLGSSMGDFLGVPQLSPDESPYSVASSISPLTPEGSTLLPDLFCPSLGDFAPPDATVCSPFFDQRTFPEDTVCPEQLQEDFACQAVRDMTSSASPSRSVSDPILMFPVDDTALSREQSSVLPDLIISQHPSIEGAQFLSSSEDLCASVVQQVPPSTSLQPSIYHPVQRQPSSSPISQCPRIIPAESRRGVKRRRTDEDDEDYRPHRTHKRATSAQARTNVSTRKPRKRGPSSLKRTLEHEEVKEERFECLMLNNGCMQSFTRKNDMERHLGSCKFNPDLHSTTVECPRCHKTLSRKDALLRHIKQSHPKVQ